MRIQRLAVVQSLFSCVIALSCTGAFAQAAGAGADFNKKDRQATKNEAERQRIEKYDKPVRPDPIGNAIIGGAAAGVVRGSVAAGAAAGARNAAVGTAVEKSKDKK